jgi:hypothetical protein
MTLETNRLVIVAEEEKLKLFRKFGALDTIPAPIDNVRASPSRLLSYEELALFVTAIEAQARRTSLLDELNQKLRTRLFNYSPFVLSARSLVDELISVATRAYMMTDYREPALNKVHRWIDYKKDVTAIYEELDQLLAAPDNSRHRTLLTLRRLYEEALVAIPDDWKTRCHLKITDALLGELNFLMEQCEVYSLVEDMR